MTALSCKDSMILVLFSCSVLAASAAGQQATTVNIAQGTVLGIAATDGDYFEFHGIPYAGSSSGTNRFKAPTPAPFFEVPFMANRKNIKCVRALGVGFEGTEDCLVANIFTPTLDNTRRLPVMVWIKGKDFNQANIPEQKYLSFRNFVEKGVVVVSLNYRESILGFLCLGTETAPGNAGLKDIIAGLKWVQANILQFGGNPEDITLFGHGSGAAAVDLVTLSPMGQGLVHKAITQSGNALAPSAVTRDNLRYALKVAEALGHKITTIEQLSDVFTRTSVSALMGVISELELLENAFAPCVERHELEDVEPFLTKTPSEIIRNAELMHIPIITGFVDNEGTTTAQMALEARNRVLASPSPVYVYQFSHSTVGLPFVGPIKPKAHSKELAYIFDNTPSVLRDRDHAIEDILVERWTNFAKTGNPTSETSPITWLPATRQNINYIYVLDNLEMNDSRNVEVALQNPNLNTSLYNIFTSNFHNAEFNSDPDNDDDSPDEVIITLPSINTNTPSGVTTATPSTDTNTPSELITVSPSISTNAPIEVTTTSPVVDTNTPSGLVTVSPTIITNAPIEVTTTSPVIDTNTPSGVITVSPSIITNPPVEVTTTSPVTYTNTPDEVTDTNTPNGVSTTSPVTNTPDGVTTASPVTETSTSDGVTTASPSTGTNTSEGDTTVGTSTDGSYTDESTTEDPDGECCSASSVVASTFLIISLFSLLNYF